MTFIKHGDGKITHVIKSDDLTDEQKKEVKKLAEQSITQLDKSTDTSQVKRSGR